MSCNECVFMDGQNSKRVSIPCNDCHADSSDKGFCVATRSGPGYIPVITRIMEQRHAVEILERARHNGTELELLVWSREKNAYCLA